MPYQSFDEPDPWPESDIVQRPIRLFADPLDTFPGLFDTIEGEFNNSHKYYSSHHWKAKFSWILPNLRHLIVLS